MSQAERSLYRAPRLVTPFPPSFAPAPNPAWNIGREAFVNLNLLRDSLRHIGWQAATMQIDDLRRRWEALTDQIMAMLVMAQDGVSRDGHGTWHVADAPDDGFDLGVTVAFHLANIAENFEDILTTFELHAPDDLGCIANETELRIAAILHRHGAARRAGVSGDLL
jgi:hypothetical protein